MMIALPVLLLPKLVCIIFAFWLYRIWRIKRESAYLWLAWGIGFLPVIHFVLFVGLVAASILLGRASSGVLQVMIPGLEYSGLAAEIICIAIALHKMYGGAVQFGDLFHPRRCLAGGKSVMEQET